MGLAATYMFLRLVADNQLLYDTVLLSLEKHRNKDLLSHKRRIHIYVLPCSSNPLPLRRFAVNCSSASDIIVQCIRAILHRTSIIYNNRTTTLLRQRVAAASFVCIGSLLFYVPPFLFLPSIIIDAIPFLSLQYLFLQNYFLNICNHIYISLYIITFNTGMNFDLFFNMRDINLIIPANIRKCKMLLMLYMYNYMYDYIYIIQYLSIILHKCTYIIYVFVYNLVYTRLFLISYFIQTFHRLLSYLLWLVFYIKYNYITNFVIVVTFILEFEKYSSSIKIISLSIYFTTISLYIMNFFSSMPI